MTQRLLISLHPNEWSLEFHSYLFLVKLERYVESCNTLNDLSFKVCVPNITEDLNLSMFKMITRINESKRLTNHISWECKYRLIEGNEIQINGGIMINFDVSV